VAIGRVGRPHGLKGAFVVEEASDDPSRFAVGARVYIDGQQAEIIETKRAGGRPVVRLDREVGRGAVLELREAELLPPAAGSF